MNCFQLVFCSTIEICTNLQSYFLNTFYGNKIFFIFLYHTVDDEIHNNTGVSRFNSVFYLGHLTAACICVQEKLERPLLWNACRHHVGEVVLTHVWNDLKIETAKSPEIAIFKRFRDNFDALSYREVTNLKFISFSEDEKETRDEVVTAIKSILEDKTFSYRGDYITFLKLALVFLTGDISKFKFIRPGAISKARWMSKSIYTCQMVLLSNKISTELPPNTIFTQHQLERLIRFVKFLVLYYVKWWIYCPLPAECALLDLKFMKSVKNYHDSVISASALKAMKNHMWYLTSELVGLSVFSR